MGTIVISVVVFIRGFMWLAPVFNKLRQSNILHNIRGENKLINNSLSEYTQTDSDYE